MSRKLFDDIDQFAAFSRLLGSPADEIAAQLDRAFPKGISHAVEDLARQEVFANSALPATLTSFHSAVGQFQREEQARRELFILPEHSAIESIATQALRAYEGTSIAGYLPPQDSIEQILSRIRSPWADPDDLYAGQGVAAMVALNSAIDHGPYAAPTIEIARSLFGDWTAAMPAAALESWEERVDAYRRFGFDPRLTAIPDPGFTDALYETGLLRDDLFRPDFVAPAPVEDEADEEYLIRSRQEAAFGILLNFEEKIREFLTVQLENIYGPSWHKQRIPGDIRQQWKEKRDDALKKREPRQPILAYADFTDYIRIIERADNWGKCFKGFFISLSDVQVSFQRLHAIRIPTMHARPITKDDFLLLTVEARRILKAIGVLEPDDQDGSGN